MKKYLATICALMMLTAFASCGDSPENNSELSDSVSESATEELTESETTTIKITTTNTIETSTSKPKYVLPELDETYEFNGLSFSVSSNWIETTTTWGKKEYKVLSITPNSHLEFASFSSSPCNSKEFAEKKLEENMNRSENIKYEMVLINDIYWVKINYINGHSWEDTVEFECQNGNKKYSFNFFYDSKENIDEDMMLSILSTIQFDSVYNENTTSTTNSVTVKTEPPTEKPTSPPVKATEPPTNPPVVKKESRTVYYTETGSKYHFDSKCGRGDYFPCTLDEAIEMGLEPCKKCTSGT